MSAPITTIGPHSRSSRSYMLYFSPASAFSRNRTSSLIASTWFCRSRRWCSVRPRSFERLRACRSTASRRNRSSDGSRRSIFKPRIGCRSDGATGFTSPYRVLTRYRTSRSPGSLEQQSNSIWAGSTILKIGSSNFTLLTNGSFNPTTNLANGN